MADRSRPDTPLLTVRLLLNPPCRNGGLARRRQNNRSFPSASARITENSKIIAASAYTESAAGIFHSKLAGSICSNASWRQYSAASRYPSHTQPLQPRPQQVVGSGGGARSSTLCARACCCSASNMARAEGASVARAGTCTRGSGVTTGCGPWLPPPGAWRSAP